MSLMGTLGKVAMGIVVAKGIGKMMGGGGRSGGSGGGLGDLLGGLVGGGASKGGAGGLGGILDSLGGGSNISNNSSNSGNHSGGLGDILNSALNGEDVAETSEQEKEAEILLKAMIYAAKADGHLDDAEKRKILDNVGDEAGFVEHELNSHVDVADFIRSVPRGMEQQVYMMSLFAIDLDSNEEAHYLDQLAKGLNIPHKTCNAIHEKLGAPAIYA